MRKCALYRVVHIESGMDYVGISVQPHVRWKQHIQCKDEKGFFHRALRKYGADAFTWRVISWASCLKGAQTLERMARHLGMGKYNLTMGGEGTIGWKHSEETRSLLSSQKLGKPRKPFTDEHKARISRALKGKPKAAAQTPFKGKQHSVETKARISASLKASKCLKTKI